MKKTFIFGHKKPDSDSVMSAIGLSYLKNKLGDHTEPRILGNINKETKYALDYFGLKEPEYLNDVKLQLKDVNYHKGFIIKDVDSIYDGASTQLIIRTGQREIRAMLFGNDKEYVKGQEIFVTWDIEDVILFKRDTDEK